VLGFEIWKNGKKLATAGLTDAGAMSLMLTFVGKGVGAASRASEGGEIEGLELRVGGIDSADPAGEQSVEWIEDAAFRLDDEIRIRIVRAREIDAPTRREPTKGLVAGQAGLRFAPCASCGAPQLRAAFRRAD
jgi:hypothetical protein